MKWGVHPYYSLSHYLKELYGEKIYKISLDAGFTCPNRDGKIDTRGCIYCSNSGSGEFAANRNLSITKQIEYGKTLLQNKNSGTKFIAYFQAFTNTYAPIDYLKQVFYEAISHPDIVGISIATRPDCLSQEIINLLKDLNALKKTWIELGLQTIHEKTALFIRRGYTLNCFDEAVSNLESNGIDIIVHLILGLPQESKKDILATVEYISKLNISGVKLHLLHILKNTDLAKLHSQGLVKVLSQDEYINLLIDCIEKLPPRIVIHRLTGDGSKNMLIAPMWSANKKVVLNEILKTFKQRQTFQGKFWTNVT